MTVTERKRQLKKHIDRLPAGKLDKAEKLLLSLNDDKKVTDEDSRKIARMQRILARADRDIAEGRTIPSDKLRRKY